MTSFNAHSFMFAFSWTRFTVSGYLGMERNAERGE